jgi:hypothetical protein
MILRWNEATDTSNLTKDQIHWMKTQRQKTIRNLSLNPTVDNPWDKIKYNFWKVQNFKFLCTASDKSNTVVQRADQRNVQGMFKECYYSIPSYSKRLGKSHLL